MRERARPLVLVVDDTEGNRYATSRILRAANFDVAEAGTGAEALAALRDEPDVMVLDINLPDMTGFEVVTRMRTMARPVSLPVLHLSASYTSAHDHAHGLEGGAEAYLTHPIDPTVFVATVRALVRGHAADRRLQEAAREWQVTFDALPDAVFLLDDGGQVQRANRAACALLRCPQGMPQMRTLESLLRDAFGEDSAEAVRRIVAAPDAGRTIVPVGAMTFSASIVPVTLDDAGSRTVLVLEDVSERVAAERDREMLLDVAQRARAEAEEASRAKGEFLSMMSHELRTPLNAIGGYAQLLELGIRGPVTEQQHDDIARIKRSQAYLLSLINDVLNFTKIERGHIVVELGDLSLDAVVAMARDFVLPQVRERGLRFELSACEPTLRVRADEEKLQQILLNLLSNALKFTPAGGEIHLDCSVIDGMAAVRVRDTGSGIPSDKLESVFAPFVQADRRYQRDQEGIGLGLAISRELARAMHGDLTVQSEPGSGSVFVLRLPLAGVSTETEGP